MDQGYVFWEKDTVDWDARYEQYRPIFEAFDARPANKPVTYMEYYEAYTGLFEGLLDHHLTGRFYSPKGIPRGACEAWVSPGNNTYYHPTGTSYERSLQLDILKKKAIAGTYLSSEPVSYGTFDVPGSYFCLIQGKNEGELIAYFRFTNFYMLQMYAYHTALPNSVSAQAPAKAFYGPRYYEGITTGAGYANNDSVVGLIIDLRGNGGGSVADLSPIIGSLSQTDTRVLVSEPTAPWEASIRAVPPMSITTCSTEVVSAITTILRTVPTPMPTFSPIMYIPALSCISG